MASIYKQGKTYWIQFYHNGKRFQESLKTKDRSQAKYLKAKKEAQLIEKPGQIDIKKINVWHVLQRYDEECRHLKAVNTRINDYIRLRDYFKQINALTLQDIKESTLRNYLSKRLDDKSIGIITANNIIRNTKTFINWCVAQNLLAYNHLAKFKQYREPKIPKRYLNRSEIEMFLTAAKEERIYPAIITAIYTGMRLGELQRLRWDDINMSQNIIMVHKSKTGTFRAIPLSDKLKEYLLSIQKTPDDLCFDFTNRLKLLSKVVKKSGLIGIGWHTFRHTFASLLLQEGVSIYKVAQYLGHSTTTTTEIYGHLQPSSDTDINKL